MALLDGIKRLLRPFLVRFERQPIKDHAALVEFLHTRSAYVAQTALFGYLKTRMGTQYRDIFQDPVFEEPLAKAQRLVFFDCLADLTIFSVSLIGQGRASAGMCRLFAEDCFGRAADMALPGERAETRSKRSAFRKRLETVNWHTAHESENAFTQSPDGLVRAAPVIEGYKDLDREIVVNSVRFRWNDIRSQLRARADLEALAKAFSDVNAPE